MFTDVLQHIKAWATENLVFQVMQLSAPSQAEREKNCPSLINTKHCEGRNDVTTSPPVGPISMETIRLHVYLLIHIIGR